MKIRPTTHTHLYLLPFTITLVYTLFPLDAFFFQHDRMSSTAYLTNPVPMIIWGACYILAMILLLKKQQQSINQLYLNRLYVFFLLFIFSSQFWSLHPEKVIINSIHFVGFAFILTSATISFQADPKFVFRILAYLLGIGILVSVISSITFPALGNFRNTGRWAGLVGNPNTFGSYAVLTIWSNLCSWQLHRKKQKCLYEKSIIVIAFYAILGTGSATSLLVGSFIFGSLFVFFGMKIHYRNVLFFGFIISTCMISLLLIIAPEILNLSHLTTMLGKNSSFTGRDVLWDIALHYNELKPWLGWSFDSNLSVLSQGAITKEGIFTFHNGFLNLLIQGGFLGVGFLTVLLFRFFSNSLQLKRWQPDIAHGFIVLVVAILLQSLSESYLVRPRGVVWDFMLFAFFMTECQLAYCHNLEKGTKFAPKNHKEPIPHEH